MNWMYALQMVLGLGLVIFVHELGHFMAARWCKVTVRVFSLGFGPPLVSFVRNGVRYQVAAIPVGGFVSMAGEYPGDESKGPQEGLLSNKSVGQRFFVYSAGVLMNLAFALVVLPILFWVGVPFTKPILGEPIPGGPAWQAGLEPGTEVLEIDGTRVIEQSQIVSEVALAPDGPVEMLVREPNSESTRVVRVVPTEGPDGFRQIGVGRGIAPDGGLAVTPGSAAARAGLADDDRLLAVVGQPSELHLERQLRRATADRGDLGLLVAAPSGAERTVEIDLEWEPASTRPLIGVAPLANRVEGVRGGGALAARLEREQLAGARLVTARGASIADEEDLLDALLERPAGGPTAVRTRSGERVDVTDAFEAHVASRSGPVAAARDIALGFDAESSYVAPSRDGAAKEAGVVAGDRVVRIGDREVATWNELLEAVGRAVDGSAPIDVVVERRSGANDDGGSRTERLEFAIQPRPPLTANLGLSLDAPDFVYRTADPLEAVATGLASTRKMLRDVWLALQRMVTADISSRNLGGPVSIAMVGYHTAKGGPSQLFYFLCLLSINLALINVLPIPVLDGGHLLFLLVEKVKGGPVSDRVLGYSQLVGFVMIVSLFVYVTWNDLQRWVLG